MALCELAEFLQTTPSSLHRELKALVNSGILQQRREGTRIYFKAETQSPLFPELHGLLEKTAGLLPTLQQALEQLKDRIDCAFVYGSVARREEDARSDVDLLVIGAVGQAELAPAVRKAEGRLGRDGQRHQLFDNRVPKESGRERSFSLGSSAGSEGIRERKPA